VFTRLLENTACLSLKPAKRQKKKTPMGIQNQPTMERLPTPVSVGLGQLAVFKKDTSSSFSRSPIFPVSSVLVSAGAQFSPVSPVLVPAGAQLPDPVLEPGPKFQCRL